MLGAGFLLAGALYLLLIDTSSLPELYAGAVVTALAAIAFAAAVEQGGIELAAPRRLGRAVWGALARIPPDIARVSVAALAQLAAPAQQRGALRAVPFRQAAGGGKNAARRAAAEALGSLAPNTIVIGVDVQRGLLLVHQLTPTGGADRVDATGLA
ncbi:MAG TPA: hypothetical protein VGD00_10195 [Solirubrobacteraceae bacterium]